MIGAQVATIASRAAGRIWPSLLTRLETDARELVLTLDDGPSPATAAILAELDIPMTWFVLGRSIETSREAWQALLGASRTPTRPAVSIANHSFDHLDAWRTSSARHTDDLSKGLRTLDANGAACQWTRPPYGRIRPATMRWARRNAQQIVLCDFLAGDFGSKGRAKDVANEVTRAVRPGSVVAMHDKGAPSLEIVALTVEALRREGWSFVPLPARTSR